MCLTHTHTSLFALVKIQLALSCFVALMKFKHIVRLFERAHRRNVTRLYASVTYLSSSSSHQGRTWKRATIVCRKVYSSKGKLTLWTCVELAKSLNIAYCWQCSISTTGEDETQNSWKSIDICWALWAGHSCRDVLRKGWTFFVWCQF